MNNKLAVGITGTVFTVVTGLFIADTIGTGKVGENLSTVVKLIVGMIPLGLAIGTLIYVLRA